MKVQNTPYSKQLVLKFESEQEYIAFMETLRVGKDAIQEKNVTFGEDFQPVIDKFIAGLEGTVIYPKDR